MNAVRLRTDAVAAIRRHSENCAPEECCGLIATDPIGEVRFVYPLTNADGSANSYTVAPEESYGAFMHSDRHGWKVGGVFHSHPDGPDRLSQRDIDTMVDETWLHILVSPAGIACYRVVDDRVVAVEVLTTG